MGNNSTVTQNRLCIKSTIGDVPILIDLVDYPKLMRKIVKIELK